MTTAERLLHFQEVVNSGQAAKHVTPAKREKLEHRQTVSERWAILERNQALAPTTRKALLQGDEETEGAKTYAKNVESYMGTVKIPIGVAGPLRVSGSFLNGEFYVPLATTEAALVASISRGIKVINLAGGAYTLFIDEGVSRVPAFEFFSLGDLKHFAEWTAKSQDHFRKLVAGVTSHGKLLCVTYFVEGNRLHLQLEYQTENASGQNMVTFGTDAIMKWIVANTPVPLKTYVLEGGLSSDKKGSRKSMLSVRGRKVVCDVTIPAATVKEVLHLDVGRLVHYKNRVTAAHSFTGMLGANHHAANALTAFYLATGQDPACAAESHACVSTFDSTDDGALYAAITMPCVLVATIGGGTSLPSQRACQDIVGLRGPNSARAMAELLAAVCLAAELSLASAQVALEFAKAHFSLSRGVQPTAKL